MPKKQQHASCIRCGYTGQLMDYKYRGRMYTGCAFCADLSHAGIAVQQILFIAYSSHAGGLYETFLITNPKEAREAYKFLRDRKSWIRHAHLIRSDNQGVWHCLVLHGKAERLSPVQNSSLAHGAHRLPEHYFRWY